MIDYKTDQTIRKPVEKVFAFMQEVSRYDDWTDMSGTRLLSGDGFKVGSQIETTMKLGLSKQTMVFEVTAFEPNRKIGWRTAGKAPLDWDAEFLFEPVDGGSTRVTSSGVIKLNGALKLMEGMMAGEIRTGEEKELERFKSLVEAMM